MLTFDDFKKEMLKRPDSFAYSGDLDLKVWGFAPFGTPRTDNGAKAGYHCTQCWTELLGHARSRSW